jgi:predicted CXXCH cytochrome family protein|tara:strand:+ start:12354 stop:14357 length:2004 start_codon:yes stop_codon:yes gene_type:complete
VTLRDSTFVVATALLAILLACGGEPSGTTEPLSASAWAGSDSCRACHPNEWEAWSASNHAHAEKLLDESQSLTATNKEGHQIKFSASRSIGVEPLVQYVIEEDSKGQVAQRAWDPKKEEWFDIFEDGRQPGDWGHWTGRGMNWNSMCARCHNTGFEKNWDSETDTYSSTIQEYGVTCEACHGPAKQHALDNGKTILGKAADAVEACAPCHSRRGELTESSHPHDHLLDAFLPELPGLSETWYADGQIRDEDYEWASFRLSRMSEAGVTCLDCHDPHSGQKKYQGDALCMQCHAETQGEILPIQPDSHTFHLSESEGSRCVNCHMPTTTYMQRDPRHDHSFSVPDPHLTLELGIPNACNRCHDDQSAEWADSFTTEWYGAKMNRPIRKRAKLLSEARSGNPSAWPPLLSHLANETHSTWKAVLVGALEAWPEVPEVQTALTHALKDDEELVRFQAVRALGPSLSETYPIRNHSPSFSDSFKGIRVEAARSFGPLLNLDTEPAKELVEFLTHNRDQPAGAAAWSTWLRDRNLPLDAVAELERARTWGTEGPELDIALASALDAAGNPKKAQVLLESSVKRSPNNFHLWFLLGLARGANGSSFADFNSAAFAMEKALELAPTEGRIWYNLGILRLRNKQYPAAKTAFEEALKLNPYDLDAQDALRSIPPQ